MDNNDNNNKDKLLTKTERNLNIALTIYFIFIIILLGSIAYHYYPQAEKLQLLLSPLFIGMGGFFALFTWKTTYIYNIKKDKKDIETKQKTEKLNLTMQLQLSQQESQIFYQCRKTVLQYFGNRLGKKEIIPIESIHLLQKHFKTNEITELKDAMNRMLNYYEYLGACLSEGYLEEDYLKKTMRGQMVRTCHLMSNYILDIRTMQHNGKADVLVFKNLLWLYSEWYDENLDAHIDIHEKLVNSLHGEFQKSLINEPRPFSFKRTIQAMTALLKK